jgi:hypothetical protein
MSDVFTVIFKYKVIKRNINIFLNIQLELKLNLTFYKKRKKYYIK